MSEGVDLAALQDVDAFQSILSDLSAETRNLLCDLVEEGDAMQSDAQTAVECDRDVQDAEFEAEGLDDLFSMFSRSRCQPEQLMGLGYLVSPPHRRRRAGLRQNGWCAAAA